MLTERFKRRQYKKGRDDRDKDWLADPLVAELAKSGRLVPPARRRARKLPRLPRGRNLRVRVRKSGLPWSIWAALKGDLPHQRQP